MKKLLLFALIPFFSIAQETSLNPKLEAFENFIGKTFKGEFSTSTPENPIYDIQQWERILNGKGIKTIHSVNNGNYGGESIMMWDNEEQIIKCWYFTTEGFTTVSTLTAIENGFAFTEKVHGNENGITEVKGTTIILENGNLKTSSKYLQNGKWVFGHEIIYQEVENEKVIFK
jgi:hypothetical protein